MFKLLSKLYFAQDLLATCVAKLVPPFLVHNLGKYFALKKAFYLGAIEHVEGAYAEFGVFTGSSFCMALKCARSTRVAGGPFVTRFVGFDSFEGFGELSPGDEHPFYVNLNFECDYEEVKRRVERRAASGQEVELVEGLFDKTLEGKKPADYGFEKAAVVMVDCDTFAASKSVFDFLTGAVQDGTIFVLDDYYSYRGSSRKGVCGAFEDWKTRMDGFEFREIAPYGMGGALVIASAKS